MNGRSRGLLDPAVSLGARLGGLFAVMLPVRYWSALDAYMPVTGSAVPSAALTFLAGAAIGVRGFLEHAAALASAHNELMLRAAMTAEGHSVTTAAPVSMNSLALFTFALTTPAGWASAYLGLTGFLRGLSAVCLDPRGDPVLTLLDSIAARASRRHRERREAATRLAREGPEAPDRVIPGSRLGFPHADFVIVSSRRKPGWDAGTIVLSGDTAYRVGSIEERQMHGHLRTLYPLTEHTDLEVFRRIVTYDLAPPRDIGEP